VCTVSVSVLACTEVYPGVPGSDVAGSVVCSVLGTWFYVMEYVAGRVFTDSLCLSVYWRVLRCTQVYRGVM